MKRFALLVLTTLLHLSLAFQPSPSFVRTNVCRHTMTLSSSSSSSTESKIQVMTQPDQAFLEQKGVFGWGTWGCGVSKFPWTYDSNEEAYLLAGRVTVTPTDGSPPATFGKGDYVTFPAGMSCTWDVTEPVHKHFHFY